MANKNDDLTGTLTCDVRHYLALSSHPAIYSFMNDMSSFPSGNDARAGQVCVGRYIGYEVLITPRVSMK